jgi:hypothetical protein
MQHAVQQSVQQSVQQVRVGEGMVSLINALMIKAKSKKHGEKA